MLAAIEATIQPDGTVRLHEPVDLRAPHRAVVIILNDRITAETALLSEQALAADWDRPEEDAAWEHFQRAR